MPLPDRLHPWCAVGIRRPTLCDLHASLSYGQAPVTPTPLAIFDNSNSAEMTNILAAVTRHN